MYLWAYHWKGREREMRYTAITGIVLACSLIVGAAWAQVNKPAPRGTNTVQTYGPTSELAQAKEELQAARVKERQLRMRAGLEKSIDRFCKGSEAGGKHYTICERNPMEEVR